MIKALHIKASTIVELLVTMIVSSIVLMCMMDGFRMAHKYLVGQSGDVGADWEFYNDYHLLNELLFMADSVAEFDNSIIIYHNGGVMASLTLIDSLIMVETDYISDTLLRRVTEMSIKPNSSDTLFVNMLTENNEQLDIFFVVESLNCFQTNMLTQEELKYEYQ